MAPFNLQICARSNILALEPYRCARDDYKDDGSNILLDANENAYGPSLSSKVSQTSSVVDFLGLNRYPDPHQHELKQRLCDLRNTKTHTNKSLTPENLFVGVGSDEAIDALLRAFCVPGKDKILTCPPTYGMYNVSAQVNDISLVKVPLKPAPAFDLDIPAITKALTNDPSIKLAYICSPGNPTGSLIPKSQILELLDLSWNGIIVLDEAYIDFAPADSSLSTLTNEYPNLVVLQTLSKAFGLAGIRLGSAFCSPEVAALLNCLKAPYNISNPTSALAIAGLSSDGLDVMRENLNRIIAQRDRLLRELPKIKGVGRFRGGESSNFLLVEILNQDGKPDNVPALKVYETLAENRGVVVRFRGREVGCEGCLRITVGTEQEVGRFLEEIERVLKFVHDAGVVTPDRHEVGREKEASSVVA